ncbi:MAG: hypothetical protein ISS50_00380 [Anaerolineae bacterium]|nr:hypothetical protein [Anaerolineae bacterium]
MKARLPADRLREKSMATLVTNHLRQRYNFSPVVAEALSDDLQHFDRLSTSFSRTR